MSSFRSRVDPYWQRNLPRDPSDFIWNMDPNRPEEEGISIVDRILEPQTIVHFLAFIFHGTLPTGGQTAIAPLSEHVIVNHLTLPYKDWAPGPHDRFAGSAVDHAMIRIGSDLDASRLIIVEKGVHAIKSRLWEGIVPISERRWKQKQLDEVEYHHLACRHLGSVIEVFAYLNNPEVQHNLVETYRLILEHWRDFDRAYNSLPDRSGEPVDVAGLWEAYIKDLYTVITTRAHSWVISHAVRMRERDVGLLQSSSSVQEELPILNRIHDTTELAARADYTIFLHMTYSTLPTMDTRRQQYSEDLRMRSRQKMMRDIFAEPKSEAASSKVALCRQQQEAQDEIRRELRGEPVKLPPVGWIADQQQRLNGAQGKEMAGDKSWGFAAYRLSYSETDEQWAEFIETLNADLSDWGDDLEGAQEIKQFATIEWFNGKDLGIAEGDIEGAKRHFQTLFPQAPEASESGMQVLERSKKPWFDENTFLAITADSVASYTHVYPLPDALCPGDMGGFVTAVDTLFDPNEKSERTEESPGYTGQLRVLGNLVYPDLYAMSSAQTQGPEDLWPLAMNHPKLVYTGPTITAQVKQWLEVRNA